MVSRNVRLSANHAAVRRSTQRGSIYLEFVASLVLIVGFISEALSIGKVIEERAVLKESVRLAARVGELQGSITMADIRSHNLEVVINSIAVHSLEGMHYNMADYEVSSKLYFDASADVKKTPTYLRITLRRGTDEGHARSVILSSSKPCETTLVPIVIADFNPQEAEPLTDLSISSQEEEIGCK